MTKYIQINFERTSLYTSYDVDLENFLKTIPLKTNREEDVHVLFSYFQLYWPIKTVVIDYKEKKSVNFAQEYTGYVVKSNRSIVYKK